MTPAGNDRGRDTPERYHGFSLQSVCWGYRDVFASAIESLFREGWLGGERQDVTAKLFESLKHAEETGFDHVLKEFLQALNPSTRWLFDLPGMFADVAETGLEFARSKICYGTGYFRILGEGGFGNSPRQVRNLMNLLRRLRTTDQAIHR